MGTQATTTELQAERAALEAEIDAVAAGATEQLTKEADDLVRRSDELLAGNDAKLATLRARRDAIDEKFQTRARADAERLAAARAAELEERKASLLGNVETFLDAVAEQEEAAKVLFAARRKMMEALAGAREAGKVLSPNGKVIGLAEPEVVTRVGNRLSTLAWKEMGGGFRYGTCQFAPTGMFNDKPYGWREQEERHLAGAVQAILGDAP